MTRIIPEPSPANFDRLHLLPRNETTCFAYWHISEMTKRMVELQENGSWSSQVWTLLVYEMWDKDGGAAACQIRELQTDQLERCYVEELLPGRCYWAEFGYTDGGGEFTPLLRSACVRMPGRAETATGPSLAVDRAEASWCAHEYERFCGYTVYEAGTAEEVAAAPGTGNSRTPYTAPIDKDSETADTSAAKAGTGRDARINCLAESVSSGVKDACLVLHAHLPYVKVDGTGRTLEERWFGEAMADVYWPLLEVLERLHVDGVPYRLGISITPTLLAMLEDADMDALARRMLEQRVELARRELRRLWPKQTLQAAAARMYARRYARLRRYAARTGGGRGWLARLRALADAGRVELLAGVGTHPFLPLLARSETKLAQLAAGRAEHMRVFGSVPRGVWLPECGCSAGLDALLQELGYAYTVLQPSCDEGMVRSAVHGEDVQAAGNAAEQAAGNPVKRVEGHTAEYMAKRKVGQAAGNVTEHMVERKAGQAVGNAAEYMAGHTVGAELGQSELPEVGECCAGNRGERSRCGIVRTEGGIAVLLRDAAASARVWDAAYGYPGHQWYRDYYQDIGYELGQDDVAELEYLRPYLLPDGTRIATGMKYARVTDRRSQRKQPYERSRALAAVRMHARDWLAELAGRATGAAGDGARTAAGVGSNVAAQRLAAETGDGTEAGSCHTGGGYDGKAHNGALMAGTADGTETGADSGAGVGLRAEAGGPLVCAFDAELFGHWWFEGPEFLEAVFREAAREELRWPLRWATPSEALAACRAETMPTVPAGFSSWGRGGYADVWLQPRTDAMIPLLHQAEERLVRAADGAVRDAAGAAEQGAASRARRAALTAAARELLLAQSSDWAFLIDAGTMPAYAQRRFDGHMRRFHRLLDGVECSETVGHTLLPELRLEWFASRGGTAGSKPTVKAKRERLRVLMLAWEYPPYIVGGLGTAVGELARELAAQGHEVHVITRASDDTSGAAAAFSGQAIDNGASLEDGVVVHHVPVPHSLRPVSFLHWVFRMNVAFARCAAELAAQGLRFDVLHAHDWLVCAASQELAAAGVPLVATMHATEHGRRAGRLAGPISPRVHALEARLTTAADETIVCSEQMRAELAHLFTARPHVIPCGLAARAAPPAVRGAGAPVLAFLGRLVPEKGVQVLLQALPHLHAQYPALTLVVAGAGPLRPELEALAAPFGDRVRFAGFLAEPAKSALLARADLCVVPSLYEPFGLVALEAMAAGTPLLVSDVGGLAGIVEDGVTGLKFPPGDAAALAERALRSLGDPAAARARAAAAQAAVRERYAIARVAAATARVYAAAIRKRHSVPPAQNASLSHD